MGIENLTVQPDNQHPGPPGPGSDASLVLLAQAFSPLRRPNEQPDLTEPPGGNAYVKALRREIDSTTSTEALEQTRAKLAAFDQQRLEFATLLNSKDMRRYALPILLSLQVDEGSGNQVLNHQLAIARYGAENFTADPGPHLDKFNEYMDKTSSNASEYDANLKAAEKELRQARHDAQHLADALAESNKVLESEKKSYSDQIAELDRDNTMSDQVKAIERARLISEMKYIDSLLPEGNHTANIHEKNIADVCIFLQGIVKYRQGNDGDANALFTNFRELLKNNKDLATSLGIPSAFKSPEQYVDFLIDETKDRGYLGLGNWWHKHRVEMTRGLIVLAGTGAGLAAGVATAMLFPPAAPLTGTAVESLVITGLTASLAMGAADSVAQGLATAAYDGKFSTRPFLEGAVQGTATGIAITAAATTMALLPEATVAGAGMTMLGKYGPRIASGLAYASVNDTGKEAIRSYYDQDTMTDRFSWDNVLSGSYQDVVIWTALGGSAPQLSSMSAGRGTEPVLASLSAPWNLALEWTLRTDARNYLLPPVVGSVIKPVARSVSNTYWSGMGLLGLAGDDKGPPVDPDTLEEKFQSPYSSEVP